MDSYASTAATYFDLHRHSIDSTTDSSACGVGRWSTEGSVCSSGAASSFAISLIVSSLQFPVRFLFVRSWNKHQKQYPPPCDCRLQRTDGKSARSLSYRLMSFAFFARRTVAGTVSHAEWNSDHEPVTTADPVATIVQGWHHAGLAAQKSGMLSLSGDRASSFAGSASLRANCTRCRAVHVAGHPVARSCGAVGEERGLFTRPAGGGARHRGTFCMTSERYSFNW